MRFLRSWTGNVILFSAFVMAFTGCPGGRGGGELALVVTPETLDFGAAETSLTLSVGKSGTGTVREVAISPIELWIEVDTTRIGELTGTQSVAVDVARERFADLPLGEKVGQIIVSAPGVAAKTIAVKAENALVVTITVDNATPEPEQTVNFTGEAAFSGSAEDLQWTWYFGDETTEEPGSTEQNPSHAYVEPGVYTVLLEVTTPEATGSRRLTISVGTPPVGPTAAFTRSVESPVVGQSIRFTDTSSAGSSAITEWLWTFDADLGEAAPTSTAQHPVYTYTTPGVYDVTLTVTDANGLSDSAGPDEIVVGVELPTASFEAVALEVTPGQTVMFVDTSNAGSGTISHWSWTFGDGATSTVQNPTHQYSELGQYDVSLTVSTEYGSDVEAKTDYIRVIEAQTAPPTAEFEVDRTRVLVGDTIQFTDRSVANIAPITVWLWDFGDGSASNAKNPTHAYAAPGLYTVSLAVFAEGGSDTVTKEDFITVSPLTELDEYVREPDPNYQALPAVGYDDADGAHVGVWSVASQAWKPLASKSNGSGAPWYHWLTIITPPSVAYDTALLVLDGTGGPPPNLANERVAALMEFAYESTSLVACMQQVPNQPLTLEGETVARSEDALVAYTLDKYFETGDSTWPVLLPMVKSAITAMDTVQMLYADDVEQFIVMGAGIRGWATWLTAATDRRVAGIVPIGFDALNLDEQMDHHSQVYNGYSEALQDYVDLDIFGRLDTPEGQALLALIDPHSYLERIDAPKLIINSAGDEFWVPDSAQFYLDDLVDPKHLLYYPDATHAQLASVDMFVQMAPDIAPWYLTVLSNGAFPSLAWTQQTENTVVVQASEVADLAFARYATSTNRDFRANALYNPSPPTWNVNVLVSPGGGSYTVSVTTSPTAFTAFYGDFYFGTELTFYGQDLSFHLTTPVFVAPDTYDLKR